MPSGDARRRRKAARRAAKATKREAMNKTVLEWAFGKKKKR